MNQRDIPITRAQVQAWINAWNRKGKLEDYIRGKIVALNLTDTNVNTYAHDSLPDTMPIADFIILDLPSYRVPTGS